MLVGVTASKGRTVDISGVRARLREALSRSGKDQRTLARETGIGENTMSALFNGPGNPQLATLIAVCRALKTNPGHILRDEGEPYVSDDEDVQGLGTVERPITPVPGVDLWLNAEGGEGAKCTPEERAWMTSIPWPYPYERHSDLVYHLVLTAFQHIQAARKPRSNDGQRRGG